MKSLSAKRLAVIVLLVSFPFALAAANHYITLSPAGARIAVIESAYSARGLKYNLSLSYTGYFWGGEDPLSAEMADISSGPSSYVPRRYLDRTVQSQTRHSTGLVFAVDLPFSINDFNRVISFELISFQAYTGLALRQSFSPIIHIYEKLGLTGGTYIIAGAWAEMGLAMSLDMLALSLGLRIDAGICLPVRDGGIYISDFGSADYALSVTAFAGLSLAL